MTLLNLIFNIIKGLSQVKEIYKFLLTHKWWMALFVGAIISTSYFSLKLVEKYYHDRSYEMNVDYDDINHFVDKILLKCGDKVAISISSIRYEYNPYIDAYLGRFYVARACDARQIDTNCIINLKDVQPSLYGVDHEIDSSSYLYFLRLGNQFNPSTFYLRNKNNIQDLSPLNKYPSVRTITESTDWAKAGIVHYLWVTSIINNKNVLYVITFLSSIPLEQSACSNQHIILENIKNFLRKQ